MFEYLSEFAGAIMRRWYVLVAVLLVLLNILGLAIPNLKALTLSWPHLIAVALVLLLWASFKAFQEVRRKTEPALVLRLTESGRGLPRFYVYSDSRIQVYAPLRCGFKNNGDDATIVGLRVLWLADRRFRVPKVARTVPLFAWGARAIRKAPFSLEVRRATESVEFDFHFEDSWVASQDEMRRLPKASRLVLDVDVAGQPRFAIPLAEYRVNRWETPPQDWDEVPPTKLLVALDNHRIV
jgi:hypothetical protein